MSRRDIAVILERLTLDHRTSLAEKACAYLQAVESNGAIRNSPSHAAICVDIAADQLSIEVSRQALILLSGAPSHVTYANALQTLTEFLTRSGNKDERSVGAGSKSFVTQGISNNTRHAHMRRLLSSSTVSTLRQLAVQYGSMEMDDLVLECLEQFFDVWVRSLVPAQRVHVVYSHEKWMGAAFWLCAMARNMVAPKEAEDSDEDKTKKATTTTTTAGSTAKPKKIGGRQGKELKDMIMAAVGHKVQKKELETTIKLIEEKVPDYFVSLMKPSGGASAAKTTAPRKRKISSNNGTSTGGAEVMTTDQGDASATQHRENGSALGDDPENEEQSGPSSNRRRRQQATDPYQRLGTKRTISNVSQISRSSDAENDEGESTSQVTRPASKRTKMDVQAGPELSSAGIMSVKKGASRKNLKGVAAASQTASQMLGQRRKTGGIYSMIPRIKYENTRAYAHYQEWRTRILKAVKTAKLIELQEMSHATQSQTSTPSPEASFVSQGKTHLLLWAMAEEYLERARSLCFVATAQSGSQPGWRAHHQDLILCAIKSLVACVSVESPSMTQLDKAKSRLRLAQVLFEETESLDRSEEEVTKAIQGSSALEIQLRLYELQTQIYIETKRFRLAKNTLRIASAEAAKYGLHNWIYQFCFFKARVHFMMDDVAGSLTTLNQGAALANQQGDFDIKMAFWIVAGQYSLMLSKWDQAIFYLQKMTPHMGIAELLDFTITTAATTTPQLPTTTDDRSPLTPVTPPSPAAHETPQELDRQQCQSQQLRVFFLILYIICMSRSGQVEKTLFALTALHGALDGTRPRDTDELQGVFRVFLKNRIDDSLQGRQQASQQHHSSSQSYVCIRWMTFSQVYCLTYLLSGICSKADMTQPMKSQQFLVEGIKVVDREFTVNDYASSSVYVRRNQRWFSLLLMTMLLHLTDVFLLKFELESAQETLLKATYWAQVCGAWDLFKWRISLTTGMMMQLGGRLEEAMDWYSICLSHSESPHQDPEGYEAKTLALISTGFIFSGERYYNHQRAREILVEAKARHAAMQSANVRCALHILDGATNEGLIPARQHLHESLKISGSLMNTQLRSISLMLLGNFYKEGHDAQAEKMLAAGFAHAAKTCNQIVAVATGFTLKDLYLQTSRGIKASEQAQRNKAFLDEVDKTFQERVLDPLLNDHAPSSSTT
ncbi:hypothetical protein BG015_007898 [Linnemannia schmuckeri]|uniref:Uncharacterized protein n=1 Tax=Linnemannia schmuckeri TaxID=64567 RepID=A0A9P5VAY5_9FUNG|nr:hypothetical protein BG015_007898 [Linnemannia schmuckeri]